MIYNNLPSHDWGLPPTGLGILAAKTISGNSTNSTEITNITHPTSQEQVLRIVEDEKGIISQYYIISEFAEKFKSMNKEFRQKVLESASRSSSVGALLGASLSSKMNSFDKDLKEEIENSARKNEYFALALGLKEIRTHQRLKEMTDDGRQEQREKAIESAEKYLQTRRAVREIVVEACQSWPYYSPEVIKGHDLNPVDILHIADTFRKFRRLEFGLVTTSTVEALLIIDSVDTALQTQISHGIRNAGPDDLANSLTLLENTDLGTIEEAIMKSLYVWFGCIQIDKTCRLSDALGNAFDKDHGMRIHSELVELSKSNPWIRRGFTSAKSFRLEQQTDKIYDWIPKGSPYWEE